MFALELITNHVSPNRWETSRKPPTPTEMTSTGVLKVHITSASSKTNFKNNVIEGPDSEDRKNPQVCDSVWTGTIPVYKQMGDPIPTTYNKAKMSKDVEKQVFETNRKEKEYAIRVAGPP